jgi:P27 family predicted phage terminase small subunit
MGKGRHTSSYLKVTPELPEVEKPTCPDWLTGEARKTFFTLVKQLSDLGVLAKVDQDLISQYAKAKECWIECEANIAANGRTQEFRGFHRQSPYVQMSNEAQKTMREIGDKLGLSPAARKRLETEDKQQAKAANTSRFAQFQAKGTNGG